MILQLRCIPKIFNHQFPLSKSSLSNSFTYTDIHNTVSSTGYSFGANINFFKIIVFKTWFYSKHLINMHPNGVQRLLLALSQREITTSYSTVYRIMKQHGLLKKAKRHPNGITREDAEAQKSENLIQRDFTASAANQKWLSDITEVPCSDGKLYLSAVMDCFNLTWPKRDSCNQNQKCQQDDAHSLHTCTSSSSL
ncbi:hypothetical protein [Paenibacillus xylaniclasticus]|uniref:hypothetical protein n=1 Tax=Paenibacillus xylaniclasticus TaxID=588083 RepID=UPI0013DFD9D8|nr:MULTISPECIES: hypothetical protein [Paenibacillus]